MECEYELVCLNKNRCYRCYSQALLRLPKEKKTSPTHKNYSHKVAQSDDSWKDLEQQVADRLNKIPTAKEARRAIASGALPFEKGDVVDSILHPECKERLGNEIQEGADKSISIKRSWLEKAKTEARNAHKTMILPFRFKGDHDKIYTVVEFEDLAELVTMMKAIQNENQILSEQNKVLMKYVQGNSPK